MKIPPFPWNLQTNYLVFSLFLLSFFLKLPTFYFLKTYIYWLQVLAFYRDFTLLSSNLVPGFYFVHTMTKLGKNIVIIKD